MAQSSAYPEPCVGGLVLNPEQEILLIKSEKWFGKYVLPGGHIELGETMEQALQREMREETGLDVFDIRFLLLQEFVYGKEYWKQKHFIFIDFSCRTKSSAVRLNHEGQEYLWVAAEDALALDLEPYTRKTVEEYIRQATRSA